MSNQTKNQSVLTIALLILLISVYPTYAQSATGSISGTISAASSISSDAMMQLSVELYEEYDNVEGPSYWYTIDSTQVNEDGTYTFSNLETGTYRIRVFNLNSPNIFQDQYFNNATEIENATDIIVDEGASVTDIDIQLDELGKIAGTVTDTEGNPLADVKVSVFNNTYGYWSRQGGLVLTGVDGSFLLSGLQPGNVRLKFDGDDYREQLPAYAVEYYDNAPDVDSATDIVVSVNTTVSDIDVQLVELASISGRATDLNGNPIAGASVSAYKQSNDGSFAHADGAATDQNGEYTVVGLAAGYFLSKLF